MSQTDTPADNAARGLAETLDWRAGRTWLVFGGFAMFLGTLSGAINVGLDVITQRFFGENEFAKIWIATSLSGAVHLGVLILLGKLIPLRDAAGKILPRYWMLMNRPLNIGTWPYLAWMVSIGFVAVLTITGQPVFDLSPTVGVQTAAFVVFAVPGHQFPASVLVARSEISPDRSEPD